MWQYDNVMSMYIESRSHNIRSRPLMCLRSLSTMSAAGVQSGQPDYAMETDEASSSGAAEESEQEESLSTEAGTSEDRGAEGAVQSSTQDSSLQETQQGALNILSLQS